MIKYIIILLLLQNIAYANAGEYLNIQAKTLNNKKYIPKAQNYHYIVGNKKTKENNTIYKEDKDNKLNNIQDKMRFISPDGKSKTMKQSQDPKTTINKQTGNCLDMARLSKYYLSKIGIKANIISVKTKDNKNHAVTIFSYNGKNYVFDNKDVKEYYNNKDLLQKTNAKYIQEVK